MAFMKQILFGALLTISTSSIAQELMTAPGMQSLQSPEAKQTVELIKKVNDSWQSRHKAECRGF